MARVRIGVEQLGAEGLRVELPGVDGDANVIDLAPGGGIRGRYEQDDEMIGLHSIRADSLVLSDVSWGFGPGRLRGALRLRNVEIEATIGLGERDPSRPGFVGMVRAHAIEGSASLRLPHGTWVAADLNLRGLELIASPDGVLTLRLGEGTIDTLRAEAGPTTLTLQRVELPQGAGLHGGHLRAGAARIGSADLQWRRRADAPAEAAEPSPIQAAPAPRPELPLDHLQGRIAAAITSDVTAPVVGRRRATHRLDLAVEDGTIDYRALEQGLAWLEGMVLGLRRLDDALILEKDVPLVPFDNETLVRWPLDAEGRELARRGRVRVATLLRPQRPEAPAADQSGEPPAPPRVQLHQLDVQDVSLELAIDGALTLPIAGGCIRGGDASGPTAERIEITGHATHAAEEPPPGELRLRARDLRLSAERIAVGDRRLSIGRAGVDAIDEALVSLVGLRPHEGSARLLGLTLEAIELLPGG